MNKATTAAEIQERHDTALDDWCAGEGDDAHKDRGILLDRLGEAEQRIKEQETDKRILMLETAQVRKNNASNLKWIADLEETIKQVGELTRYKWCGIKHNYVPNNEGECVSYEKLQALIKGDSND